MRVASAGYHYRVRGDRGQFTSGALISYEDNVNSIKRRLWLETDRAYRTAAERLIRIKTNTQVKVAEADDSDDFSTEAPASFSQVPSKLKFTDALWQARIRTYSARFQNYPSVLTSHVSVLCQRIRATRSPRARASRTAGALRAWSSTPRPRRPMAPT